MITIGKPYVTVEGDTAYLRAPVQVSEDTARIYMEKTGSLKNTAWLTAVDYPPSVWQKEGFGMWFSAQREDVYRDLIVFSQRPEASSARESVQQILRLADKYDNEASRLFQEIHAIIN